MHENHAREYLQQVFGENWCEYFTRCVLSSKNGGTTSWNQYTVTCTSKPSLAHFLHGRLSFLVACGCKLDKLNCGSTHSSLLKVQVWVKFQKRVWFLDYYLLLVKVDSTFCLLCPPMPALIRCGTNIRYICSTHLSWFIQKSLFEWEMRVGIVMNLNRLQLLDAWWKWTRHYAGMLL